ncbi:MAG: CopD family protein [Anaerolineales bacterium]|nr:CopD family protein [Anaerolineales bacterium]
MLATVTWIGSLAAINILVLPASNRALKLTDQLNFITALQKRLEPLAWFCMGLLLVTGLFQLSTSPHYDGFLSLSTQWSFAILIKHGLAIIMVVVSAIQTWEVLPAIQRTLMKKGEADEEELRNLQRKEIILLRISLLLSALILGATAVARVS